MRAYMCVCECMQERERTNHNSDPKCLAWNVSSSIMLEMKAVSVHFEGRSHCFVLLTDFYFVNYFAFQPSLNSSFT